MNARVFLLILVTAVFMAAWDGDQAAMQAALARRSEYNAQRIAAAQVDETPVRTVLVSNTQVDSVATPATPVTATKALPAASISADAVPLPPGITAGTYLAVNQSGQAVELEVTEISEAPDRDFYMADAKNGDRWYLIRVK